MKIKILCSMVLFILVGCSGVGEDSSTSDYQTLYPNLYAQFSNKIDFSNLPDYASQTKPNYITEDNTSGNEITTAGAILGRILFYDINLSSNNTVSCATCHQQAHAFSDTADVSVGVNGVTGRHSMRLVNSKFSREGKFFWDERANTLEEQTTQPIQDHNEMGFSGTNGDQDISGLITKLEGIAYYPEAFTFAFGSSEITEARMQQALAQFIRSIQSFDSKYDIGRGQAVNDQANFVNFTADENAGKSLFLNPPNVGGAGCAGCHRPPEFDIDPNSLNNGVVGIFGTGGSDLTNTRSPSLRDAVKVGGGSNGKFMHDASLSTLTDVVNHYNNGISLNGNLDPRLSPGGVPQNLGLSGTEVSQLVDFLETLSGTSVYTDEKWSSPF